MHKTLRLLLFLLLPLGMAAQPKIQLVNFSAGFVFPVDIATCGDSRIFVVERNGLIWALDSVGARLDTFLYIDPEVNSTQNEQGLLGLVFDPNYAQNGYFYVDYTQNGSGNTRVSRFKVMPDNPNRADPTSELTILEQFQPNWNHNGGCLKFGPDGYLYISFGDGGGANDINNYAQNEQSFLGKILRIDVGNSTDAEPYKVPPDNPFISNPDYLPEIWSLGWRNPWRYSFDRLTGDMWVGDVGQNLWEEADFEPAGVGGRNYGWRCYEGTHTFNTAGCEPASSYVMPFFDFAHGANGCSVTGGFVYRGSKYPDLYGYYIFSDYCSGRVWKTKRNADNTFTTDVLATFSGNEFSAFGEDNKGELYACQYASGKVVKIKELCSPFQIKASTPLAICDGSMAGSIAITPSGATGTVTYLWSTGATSAAVSGLNPGAYTVEAKDGNSCIRRDTVTIPSATPPTPVIQVQDTSVCLGSSFAVKVASPVPNVTYTWYQDGVEVTPAPGGLFLATSTSTFQVQASSQGCESPLSAPVVVNVVSIPSITLSSVGDTIYAQVEPPGASLQWFLDGTFIPDATDDVYVAQESGHYTLVATSAPDCQGFAAITIVVSSTKLPESVRRFTLSPNPATQRIMVEMEQTTDGHLEFLLSDESNRIVFRHNTQERKVSLPVDLSGLPSGAYFLRVKTEKGDFVRRVVKK